MVALLLREVVLSVNVISAMLTVMSKGGRSHDLILVSSILCLWDTGGGKKKKNMSQHCADGSLATRGVLMAIFGRTVREPDPATQTFL